MKLSKFVLGLLLFAALCVQPAANANSVVRAKDGTSEAGKEKKQTVLKVKKSTKLVIKAVYLKKEGIVVFLNISAAKSYGVQGKDYRLRITPIDNSESMYNYMWEIYEPLNGNNVLASGYGYRYVPEWVTNINAYIAGNEQFYWDSGWLIVVVDDEIEE